MGSIRKKDELDQGITNNQLTTHETGVRPLAVLSTQLLRLVKKKKDLEEVGQTVDEAG